MIYSFLKYCLIGFNALLLVACSDKSTDLKPNTPIGNFEALWEIIDTRYCYLDYKNIDWDEVGAVYRTYVDTLSTTNYRGLFDTLASMLDSLQDGHVNLYSSFDMSRSRAWYEGYPTNFNSSVIYSNRYLGLDYKTAGGLQYARIANDSIGYVYYSSFSNSVSASNMYYVLDYFSDCKGLILDVRNNGGGTLEYAKTLAATFFKEKTTVGYMQHKTGTGHNDFSELVEMEINPDAMSSKWFRPVIILCNRRSYSATNFFVNAMKQAPYALIMGGRSGGGGGIPLSYDLPNGWLVRLSSVPMYDTNKIHIEDGIDPDVFVNTTAEKEALGYDDIIEKAVEVIVSSR